jgi:hypothetical protein
MLRLLGRDDRECDRSQFAAHRQTSVAPQRQDQGLVCSCIGGAGFPAPWGRNPLLLQDLETLAGRALPPFQALHPGFHLVRALHVPQRAHQGRCFVGECDPLLALKTVFLRGLEDLGNGLSGDRRALAAVAP